MHEKWIQLSSLGLLGCPLLTSASPTHFPIFPPSPCMLSAPGIGQVHSLRRTLTLVFSPLKALPQASHGHSFSLLRCFVSYHFLREASAWRSHLQSYCLISLYSLNLSCLRPPSRVYYTSTQNRLNFRKAVSSPILSAPISLTPETLLDIW